MIPLYLSIYIMFKGLAQQVFFFFMYLKEVSHAFIPSLTPYF